MRSGLEKVVELIELASFSVAKLMASVRYNCFALALQILTCKQDSVPKFLRDSKYQSIIREHQIDINLAQRALSPAPSSSPNEKPSLSRSNTNRVAKS